MKTFLHPKVFKAKSHTYYLIIVFVKKLFLPLYLELHATIPCFSLRATIVNNFSVAVLVEQDRLLPRDNIDRFKYRRTISKPY